MGSFNCAAYNDATNRDGRLCKDCGPRKGFSTDFAPQRLIWLTIPKAANYYLTTDAVDAVANAAQVCAG